MSPAYQWTPPKRCNSLQIVHFLHINTQQPTQQSNWHLKIQKRVLSFDSCRLLVAKATPSLRRLPLLGWSSSFQQRVLSPRDPNNLPSFFSFLSADISRRELNNLARLSAKQHRAAQRPLVIKHLPFLLVQPSYIAPPRVPGMFLFYFLAHLAAAVQRLQDVGVISGLDGIWVIPPTLCRRARRYRARIMCRTQECGRKTLEKTLT